LTLREQHATFFGDASTTTLAANIFDRVCVINLRHRSERLARFQSRVATALWPFRHVEVFKAADGNGVSPPSGWRSGSGAWGCACSHRAILTQAIADKLESVLILEDDAVWGPNFTIEIANFLAAVPTDWEILMLGGQHMVRPEPARPGIVRCLKTVRLHAYGIRGPAIADLLTLWEGATAHIDWLFARWIASRRVYAPSPWIIGQDEGQSDTAGGKQVGVRYWQE